MPDLLTQIDTDETPLEPTRSPRTRPVKPTVRTAATKIVNLLDKFTPAERERIMAIVTASMVVE